jgi:hypothetical protein
MTRSTEVEKCRPGRVVQPRRAFLVVPLVVRSRDSAVGIATGRPRVRSSSPGRVNDFLFST